MANLHRQKSNFLKKDILPLTTKICVNRQINPSDCIAAVPDDQLSMKHLSLSNHERSDAGAVLTVDGAEVAQFRPAGRC